LTSRFALTIGSAAVHSSDGDHNHHRLSKDHNFQSLLFFTGVMTLHASSILFRAGKIRGNSTNNYAELFALITALKEALDKNLKRILVITDSNLVYKFMRGALDITKQHLVPLAKEISSLASEFDAIYISHVKSHENDVFENVTADALCTWARSHEHDLRYEVSKQAFNPSTFSDKLHKTSGAPSDTDCTFCHLSHLESTCCLKIFSSLILLHSKKSPCLRV
jgi:ribonuclease HI